MLCTTGPPGVVTATVMEVGGADTDLGKAEYWTVTGVWGRVMGSGLMLGGGWVTGCSTVLGWAACAGAGVMVVPSLYTTPPWVRTLGKGLEFDTTRPGPVTVTPPWLGGRGVFGS